MYNNNLAYSTQQKIGNTLEHHNLSQKIKKAFKSLKSLLSKSELIFKSDWSFMEIYGHKWIPDKSEKLYEDL